MYQGNNGFESQPPLCYPRIIALKITNYAQNSSRVLYNLLVCNRYRRWWTTRRTRVALFICNMKWVGFQFSNFVCCCVLVVLIFCFFPTLAHSVYRKCINCHDTLYSNNYISVILLTKRLFYI